MPKSSTRTRPKARPPRPPAIPAGREWLIEEAVAVTAIALEHHHPNLSLQARMTLARTAVTAAHACLPRLVAMDGPAPLAQEQTDPRAAGGDLVVEEEGAVAGVVVDPARAVLVDTVQAVLIDAADVVLGAQLLTRSVGLLIGGQINGTDEQARILYVLPIEGAADLVAEVFRLGMRSGPIINTRLSQLINDRINANPHEGAHS